MIDRAMRQAITAYGLVAIVSAIAVKLSILQAWAYGAVAQGPLSDMTKVVVVATDRPTQQDADSDAMTGCKKRSAGSIKRGRCEVSHRFSHACVALSSTEAQEDVDIAVGATLIEAENKAVENCRLRIGEPQSGKCKIFETDCDTR